MIRLSTGAILKKLDEGNLSHLGHVNYNPSTGWKMLPKKDQKCDGVKVMHQS